MQGSVYGSTEGLRCWRGLPRGLPRGPARGLLRGLSRGLSGGLLMGVKGSVVLIRSSGM